MTPLPGSQFPGIDDIPRKIKDLERAIRELSAANPYGSAGIRAVAGGIVVEGTQTVNGPLDIKGDLSLPAGSITDASLANPVQFATASQGITNYAITTTSTVRASVDLTVPEGYSQALVLATATAMGTNSGTDPDALYLSAVVQAVNGGELYTSAPAGLGAGLSAPFNPTLTGLSGGDTITVGVATRAGLGTWAAVEANQCSISATAIYLK